MSIIESTGGLRIFALFLLRGALSKRVCYFFENPSVATCPVGGNKENSCKNNIARK
jgi:hypothetical protein